MIDPVCGMIVNSKTAPGSTHEGQSYSFCSIQCKEQFDKDPERYAARLADQPE